MDDLDLDLIYRDFALLQKIARMREVLDLPVPDTFLGRSQVTLLRWYQYEYGISGPAERRRLADAIARLPNALLEASLQKLVQAAIEQAGSKTRAAFYLANSDRTALHHITGMPQEYARCVDGFAISSLSLACGLAAATRRAVITPDVTEEPSWSRWQWLAKDFDYRGCWSFPIETMNGKLLGTFAMYYREPTEPKQRDLELVSAVTRAAAKIIPETLTW